MTRQIVLDTETTGLYVNNGDRIIEIGCVEIIDRRITDNNYHQYINPERDSHEEALAIHGLTTEFLSTKPKFAEIAENFCKYIEGAELVIHNAAFDVGFLDAELKRLKLPRIADITVNVIDSLALAKKQFPGKRNNLDILCDRFEIDNSQRTLHGALLDAQLLAEVYLAMTRGQKSLIIDDSPSSNQQGNDSVSNVLASEIADIPMIVLSATSEELATHESVLDGIEKDNKGKACLWRASAESDQPA